MNFTLSENTLKFANKYNKSIFICEQDKTISIINVFNSELILTYAYENNLLILKEDNIDSLSKLSKKIPYIITHELFLRVLIKLISDNES